MVRWFTWKTPISFEHKQVHSQAGKLCHFHTVRGLHVNNSMNHIVHTQNMYNTERS